MTVPVYQFGNARNSMRGPQAIRFSIELDSGSAWFAPTYDAQTVGAHGHHGLLEVGILPTSLSDWRTLCTLAV